MDYPKFISQKYKAEVDEIRELMNNHNSIVGAHNQLMNQYRVILLMAEVPNLVLSHKKFLYMAIWRLIENIREQYAKQHPDEYIINKLTEALDLLLNGYKLSDQECDAICNIYSLPANTKIGKFIRDARTSYIATYLCKKLLPYWKDELTPECIEYVTAEIEKNIKDTNEFISKEDLLNSVYFVEPRPHNWREQLTDAGIPVDD